MIGLPQLFTGPLVNMMLILTSLVITPAAGALLGAITPVVAVVRGQLPSFLMPMIPFIIVANILFVMIFSLLQSRRLRDVNVLTSAAAWLGLLCGALVKFLVLYYTTRFILPIVMGANVSAKLLAMMSLPQFFTAVAGGAFAFLVYNMLRVRLHFK
ncbi:hypothetical protein JW998_11700 [candidate division KSB1 bacterium]|nr:hypothetical protein [candidate division KSB1 bacterium]